MGQYSMPKYFQNMPTVGKGLVTKMQKMKLV